LLSGPNPEVLVAASGGEYAPDMDDDATPFAHIPEPGVVYERPNPYTPEGEIAFFGALARGAAGTSRGHRVARIVAVLLILGVFLFGLLTMFIAD
jgi:hypothetical protein